MVGWIESVRYMLDSSSDGCAVAAARHSVCIARCNSNAGGVFRLIHDFWGMNPDNWARIVGIAVSEREIWLCIVCLQAM